MGSIKPTVWLARYHSQIWEVSKIGGGGGVRVRGETQTIIPPIGIYDWFVHNSGEGFQTNVMMMSITVCVCHC